MMESWVNNLTFWHWLAIAAILIILEIFSPGAFFLWLGIAAGCVAVVMFSSPELTWQSQLIIFAGFSVASIVAWQLSIRMFPIEKDQGPILNRRAELYVGRTFVLAEAIVNGVGKIKVDDTTWRVQGPDCPIGTQVVVTGVNGTILEVKTMS